MKIDIDGVTFGYSSSPVLKDVTLTLEGAQFISIIGPNGVGKSTLIHCINRILSPDKGTVMVDGDDVKNIPLKELAKDIGYVPYTSSDSFPLSVVDTVMMGRHPYSKWGSREDDLRKVYEALEELDIIDLALRPFNELSAGQRQRVVLARGLVQEPRLLLLDEPTSNLDIHHQLEVTKTLKRLSREKDIMVIMISHDLNIAAKYADNMILLYNKGIYAAGLPNDVITVDALRTVYNVDVEIFDDHGRPHIVIQDSVAPIENGDWTSPYAETGVVVRPDGTTKG
ncbi:MAG: ABC transporter ATP-binding protein [archaeon]|nr:ABC transporter ATP-binding protein [archaeon]